MEMFFKKGDPRNFEIFTAKHLRWSLFLIKFQTLQTETSFESSKQVFSCEHCKIFMNSVFDITPPVVAFADLVFLIKNMWDGFCYKGL